MTLGADHAGYDVVIVGGGVSGSFIADELTRAGLQCVMLEAGKHFGRETYPRKEIDANSQLYWGGGIELNKDASIGFLRPKVVGGGSIVNQALLDRFDDVAFDAWQETSGVEFLSRRALDPWYDQVSERIAIRTVPEVYRNGNAEVFRQGFERNGYRYAPLERAQRDCRYQDGNCCIECLMGCRIDSKQSTPVTVLKRALEAGLDLVSEFEAERVQTRGDEVTVTGRSSTGAMASYTGRRLVLAAGAIGNSRLLLGSPLAASLPALGRNFYTHPQYMVLGVYDEPIGAHRGPMQSYKSADPTFRRAGFKLENVFAPPVAIAMLVPGFAAAHQRTMRDITHLACIEVAVRDTNPGRIRLGRRGAVVVEKRLNDEDRRRRDRGTQAIRNIFTATGAREILVGNIAIGLHLMGGCNLGTDPARSVTAPTFQLHGVPNVYVGDSSIFPNAPGINPSFTIMALSLMAAARILEDARA
jgi:choline dehydrogenase-like flavoprotein